MTDGPWLERHEFLAPIARLERAIDATLAALAPRVAAPRWEAYLPEYERGVPLLRSADGGLDLAPAAAALATLAARLAADPPVEPLARDLGLFDARLRAARPIAAIEAAVADTTEEAGFGTAGLVSLLAWATLRRSLAETIAAFAAWRRERHWPGGDCPTCGAPPPMARLLDEDGVRQRDLVCGRCATRWRFKRIGCPHCGDEDPAHLSVLEIEGEEAGLRLDCCETCKGYVKTWTGAGEEDVMLADWTTLHLDALAAERGLQRRGASLYEL